MSESSEICLVGSTAGVVSTGTVGSIHAEVSPGGPGSSASPSRARRDSGGSPAVFVSHAHEDSPLADRLVAVLRAGVQGLGSQDIRCTSLGAHDLVPGVLLSSRLRAEVTGAEVVLGLLTERSQRSPYVLFELGAAWGAQVPVIAVRIGTTESLGPLDDYLAVDLVDDDDVERMLEGIATTIRRKCEPARARRTASHDLLCLAREVRTGR